MFSLPSFRFARDYAVVFVWCVYVVGNCFLNCTSTVRLYNIKACWDLKKFFSVTLALQIALALPLGRGIVDAADEKYFDRENMLNVELAQRVSVDPSGTVGS